jgi:hypothetical protein
MANNKMPWTGRGTQGFNINNVVNSPHFPLFYYSQLPTEIWGHQTHLQIERQRLCHQSKKGELMWNGKGWWEFGGVEKSRALATDEKKPGIWREDGGKAANGLGTKKN